MCGAVFIIISDALRDLGPAASPPGNMHRALIFTAVLALATVPAPLALGLFGRAEKIALRRVESDERQRTASRIEPAEARNSQQPEISPPI